MPAKSRAASPQDTSDFEQVEVMSSDYEEPPKARGRGRGRARGRGRGAGGGRGRGRGRGKAAPSTPSTNRARKTPKSKEYIDSDNDAETGAVREIFSSDDNMDVSVDETADLISKVALKTPVSNKKAMRRNYEHSRGRDSPMYSTGGDNDEWSMREPGDNLPAPLKSAKKKVTVMTPPSPSPEKKIKAKSYSRKRRASTSEENDDNVPEEKVHSDSLLNELRKLYSLISSINTRALSLVTVLVTHWLLVLASFALGQPVIMSVSPTSELSEVESHFPWEYLSILDFLSQMAAYSHAHSLRLDLDTAPWDWPTQGVGSMPFLEGVLKDWDQGWSAEGSGSGHPPGCWVEASLPSRS
ncbi:hypothetical protein BXZ70DRAFT_1080353 [Cristinia sonorae]|uniref:Uncharacterized protein n=1 Tax=Cristinia sonorae TaxID=1940300 RepID=A0A8K0XKX3_9AGAR|nr:hypothetical protein BXZ70DRAFT_1080353 [Cristinia sonorae]